MEKFIQRLQKDFIVCRIPSIGSGVFIESKTNSYDKSIAFLNMRQMSSAFQDEQHGEFKEEIKIIKEVITEFYGL